MYSINSISISNNVNNNNINNFNGENVVNFDDDTENFFDFVIYFLVMIITVVRNCVKYAFNLRDSGLMNEITINDDAYVDAESTYEYDDIFSVTNQTIPIVSEQSTMIAFVNDRYKDILLIDSGSCCNAISKSKVDEIRRVTNSQIPRIKCNVPKIVDVNGEKIETDGIVLLDVMLPNSKLMIRRIPFVILLVNSKFLFGTNTLRARGLWLVHEDEESKLRCDSNPKKITDYHVDELQTDKKNIKIKYNKYDPIDITSTEEMEIPKGASMNLCCQVGVPIKSNLNKILYKVDKPFVEYMGYTSIMKKGKIYVALRNNGPTTVVQKESPIGYAYPIGNDDIDVNPIPTIANMTNELSQHDFYRVGCVCQIKEKWPQHKLVSFGIDARSTFFNYNKFDKMILDPDWTLNNKYLGYQDTVFPWGNNQESIFVIRDLYTLSIKQVTILTKVAERNEGMKILCVSFPHPGHIKVITNQLTIYLNSWLLFEVEDTWSFDELPNVIIESDTRFKDGIKTAFPSVKLMIHVPISKQNQMEYLNKLKDCIDAHFLYRRIVYRYQEDLVDKGTQDTYLLAGFQKAPLTGGTKPTKKCSKCVICRNKLPRPKHAPNQESIDAITTAPCESIMHDHRNKYTMFNDKRIANELNLIDNIEEELIKSQMETIKLTINNVTEEYDKDSELSITKLEDQCPDDIGGFDAPKPASNWRELINLDQTNKDSLKWLVPHLDEYADIIQMEKRQRGNLKLSHMISKILTSEKNPYPRFRVLNGTLLCRLKRKNTKNPTINDYGIMLNTHSAVNIIAMIHSLNHAGSQTTMKMFKQYYATRSLKDIVKSISIACKHCSMFRLRNSSILQGFLNMSTSILETLVLDHVFLPPSIFNGLKYIGFLSICDEASRMHFSKPVRTEKTSEVAAILREVLSSLGEVKTIISDNATNLAKNKVIIDTCSSFGVKCRTILPYNSRGNGLIELQNKRMRHIVTTLAKMLNKPLPEVFGIAKITINSLPIGSIHNNAVVSPHELVYGKEPDIFHSLNKAFGFQDVSNIRRQKERKELEHFLKSQKEERIREYKARLEQTPMKHLREGALVLRQHTGDNYKKGFPKYMDDIFIIVDSNGLELKLQNFTNTNDTNIYCTHLRHVKIFTPRDIKYYQHLDPSMKRLLGHELDKDIIERARKAGELLPDYNKKKFEHLKVQMGKTNKPETIDLASDSDEPVFIPKTDNQSIIESKAFKDSLRRLKTEPPIKEEIEPHVKTEKWLTDHYNIQPRSNLHEKTIEPKVESSPKSWLNKSIDKLKRALSESPKSNHEPKSEAATSLTTKQESDQSNASTANREPLEEGIDEQPIYSRRLRQKPRIDYREWTRGYNKYNKPTKKK